jgi:GNAT superfamily N-acetyltransferase
MKPEQNFTDLCTKSSKLLNGINIKDYKYSYATTPGLDWFSRIFDITEISDLVSNIDNNNIPCSVIVSENENNLISSLEKLGFTQKIVQTYMELDLEKYSVNDVSSNLQVINTQELLGKWFHTLTKIFKVTNIDLFKYLLIEKDIILLGITSEEEILSTALIYIQHDLAGLHFIGTEQEKRGKGYGKLIVENALRLIKCLNVKKVILQSSVAGLELYKKIGFIEQCKIYHYHYEQ